VNLNERNFRPKANAENLKSLILPDCPSNIQTDAVKIANGESVKGYEELYSKIEKVLAEYNKTQKVQKLLSDQLTLLENLNQAILQEAVQGKLVSQGPNDEPASELLKRIKDEKAKSGKKEKPLPPIKPEEIPFAIPENWVWCRLGEIAIHNSGKTLDNGRNTGTLRNYITTSNLYWGYFQLDNLRQMKIEDSELDRCSAQKGDLLICEGGEAGRSAIWNNDEPVCFQNHIHRVRPLLGINSDYIYHYMRKIFFSGEIHSYRRGMGIKNLSGSALSSIIIPLPPIAEQENIVSEIQKQLAKTRQLKEYIIANQQVTEQLLKALLHQAFEVENKNADQKPVEQTKGKVIELKPTNIDYYRRTVLAAEIVWQLHKEPTLGHLKLQKLIYLCQKSADMQLPTNFLRQAMGPYDNRLMRSIDKQLKEKKWFEYKKEQVLKYQSLEKAGQHHNDFLKYFSAESDSIQFIIDKFKTIKSDIVEIVATLYACMDNMLQESVIFSEALLIQRFYDWSEEKKKFSEDQIKRVFSRMKETGIIPKEFVI